MRRCRRSLPGFHFNPLPPHGGRPKKGGTVIGWIDISIHSLRMEGDFKGEFWETRLDDISIHSLRMEGDVFQAVDVAAETGISIHSLRMEGDIVTARKSQQALHFNPLPPHGGRLCLQATPRPCQAFQSLMMPMNISIHSLRMEGDPSSYNQKRTVLLFQSTPSAWRETRITDSPEGVLIISIHSLRMEGD